MNDDRLRKLLTETLAPRVTPTRDLFDVVGFERRARRLDSRRRLITACCLSLVLALSLAGTELVRSRMGDRGIALAVTAPGIPAPPGQPDRPGPLGGWGPDRRVFDYNNGLEQFGSADGPVLNSFINTPSYGDERAFVDAQDTEDGLEGPFRDDLNVQVGHTYLVRAYIHNGADPNAGAAGTAINARIRFKLLDGFANGFGISAYVTADNAARVYDTVTLRNETIAFGIEFVPGSAVIYSDRTPEGQPADDAIIGEGVRLTSDGLLPAGFEDELVAVLKVRIVAPALKVDHKGRLPGEREWKPQVTVRPGDTIEHRIEYTNAGTAVADDVTVRAELDPNERLVPSSIRWTDAAQRGVSQPDNILNDGGVNLGSYAPAGEFVSGTIIFSTTVTKTACTKESKRSSAFARAKHLDEIESALELIINCRGPSRAL